MSAPMPETDRAQLASLESEASLIGAMLLDNAAFDRVSDVLRPEHLASDMHREVFVELARQLAAGHSADVVTVFEGLRGRLTLADLTALAQYVPSGANIRRHAALVVESWQARQLAAVSSQVYELAHDSRRPIAERVEQAQAQLARLLDDAPQDDWVSAHEGMLQHTQALQERSDGHAQAWPTGLTDLDEYLDGGLRPGSLVVIGGRPGHGKTSIAMSIGLHMAARYPVALMSMEMPHRDVRDRMTAMLGRVSLSSVLRPQRGQGLDWQRVLDGAQAAQNLNFYVTDQSGLNISQVKAKARNLKRLHGLKVLIVDYIGLMVGLDSRQPRAYQIEEITKGLKALAKELGITVLALAQLNRQIEQRTRRNPMLSDFRDSGSIEQDADIVLGLHREALDKPGMTGEWECYAELSVLKNRQGRTGAVGLFYEGRQVRFTGWEGPPPGKAAVRKDEVGFE